MLSLELICLEHTLYRGSKAYKNGGYPTKGGASSGKVLYLGHAKSLGRQIKSNISLGNSGDLKEGKWGQFLTKMQHNQIGERKES